MEHNPAHGWQGGQQLPQQPEPSPWQGNSGQLLPASLRSDGQDPMLHIHTVWPDLISPFGEGMRAFNAARCLWVSILYDAMHPQENPF